MTGLTERPGSSEVEAAAQLIFQQGWVLDDSAFTPGRAIWTAENVNALHEHFVAQPDVSGDSFLDKFRKQLQPVSDAGRQLAAELLYLHELPLANVLGATKRQSVNGVLNLIVTPTSIPPTLAEALDHRIFDGGRGSTAGRWRQVALLIELTAQVKDLSHADRRNLLADPWAFRDFIRSAQGSAQPAQRNALLYLAHPADFLPIVSVEHRKAILTAFADRLGSPTGDADRDLRAIVTELNAEAGAPVDLYEEPHYAIWRRADAPESDPDVAEIRRAWRVRGSAVLGENLIGLWVADGFVSLAASQLAQLPADLTREALSPLVEEGYSYTSYSQRQQKLNEFLAFLTTMAPQDVVVTTAQEQLHVGRLTGEAVQLPSPDGRSNLRRTAVWEQAIPVSEVPESVRALLQAPSDVVELTAVLPQLDALIQQHSQRQPRVAPGAPPTAPPPLADATPALAEDLLMPQAWLQDCVELLRDRPQLILFGPPGTGKTYVAQRLARHLAGDDATLVQFHPSYSYEDFFEGFRPSRTGAGFELRSGPFRRVVDAARERPESWHVLVIDEINRGNLAKIFGELYFLLEYRDQPIELLYSEEATFTLPPNVIIVGTMNTADRSIALVDAAMRRRFAFVSLHPGEEPTASLLRRWLTQKELPTEAADLLDALNDRIDDADMRVGPSYLMRPAVYAPGGFERVWRTAIEPLLEEHHYGDGTDVPERYGLVSLRAMLAARANVATESTSDVP